VKPACSACCVLGARCTFRINTSTLSGRLHTSEPEPGHSQHEPPSTPTRFYKPSDRCAPIELRLTQSTKQVVNRLIVGVEHVPRSWSMEVHWLDIACVHRDIPKDLTLSMEKRRHLLTPHLVVIAIKVWRTRIPFLVRHPWILD
jgi:hypothetical protein